MSLSTYPQSVFVLIIVCVKIKKNKTPFKVVGMLCVKYFMTAPNAYAWVEWSVRYFIFYAY